MQHECFHLSHRRQTTAGACESDGGERDMSLQSRSRCLTFLLLVIVVIGSFPLQSFAQQLAKSKGKFLGASTSYYVWRNFALYWNQVTPGDAGKWGSVTSVRGQYNWTNLDYIYDFATQRSIPYKHHVLVWGSQQPSWIDGLDSANQRAEVENWIHLVGQRYPKMSFIDVVNEPFHNPLPAYKNALGGNGTTGWDWVITAFQWARQYCAPGVKLLLNEYNVLGSDSAATNYINLINLLKNRGLIDGIGVQGHYFEFRSHLAATSGTYIYDIATIKKNLNRLTAIGLPVYISEFDIDEPIDSNQVAQYKTYFPILWSNPGVKGITLWGYIEDDVWSSYPNTFLLHLDGRERPALQWLRTYIWSPQLPVLVSPLNLIGIQRNPLLVWHTSETAASYHVQVSDNSVFPWVTVDSTVTDTLLQLKPLDASSRFYWRVSGVNTYGASDYSVTASFITGDLISAVEELGGVPTVFSLSQNYPNPFNPTTTIEFRVSSFEFVSLKVFDALGREVSTLVNEVRPAGVYTVRWDASSLPSGVYYYRLQAGAFMESKKMVLMK